MKKLIFVISALFVFGIAYQARAEMSPSAVAGNSYLDNQVFTIMYNNSGSSITSNAVVALDVTGTAGSTLGSYITTVSTDSPYVIGVTDETIADGSTGRVCIRGPHKAWFVMGSEPTAGQNITAATTAGRAAASTTTTTAAGHVGVALAVTSGTYTHDSADGSDIWWIWVNPHTQ